MVILYQIEKILSKIIDKQGIYEYFTLFVINMILIYLEAVTPYYLQN